MESAISKNINKIIIEDIHVRAAYLNMKEKFHQRILLCFTAPSMSIVIENNVMIICSSTWTDICKL